MTIKTLIYFLHDDPDAFRIEMSGALMGSQARGAYQAWLAARWIIGDRALVIDITFINEADDEGVAILADWRRHGAKIVSRSALSYAIAERVLRVSFPDPEPRLGFLRRFLSHWGVDRAFDSRKDRIEGSRWAAYR